ncbi:hypothetical protein ACIBCA_20180 [Kitasatospora sp. NPDC051170]|uniref:hypothetical protein n=1 Tax=Kitasatospora sp. NPDC051170 TaxID=3364056 RepID=UPI0037BB7275
MTIDLIPGRGVRPPAPLPEPAFGLGRAELLRLFAPHGDVLPDGLSDTFVCGTVWALSFNLPGLTVTLCARNPGRFEELEEPEEAYGLDVVFISRNPHDDRPPCPVGLYGVDVFGWPAHEVVEALRAEGLALPDLAPGHGAVRHGPLHLHRQGSAPRPPTAGRKARHEPPFTFGAVSLSAADPSDPDTRRGRAAAR